MQWWRTHSLPSLVDELLGMFCKYAETKFIISQLWVMFNNSAIDIMVDKIICIIYFLIADEMMILWKETSGKSP